MLPSRRSRKKQTQLAFSPLSSSSPSRSEAHVRVSSPMTPSKRHLVIEDSESDSHRRRRAPDGVNSIDLSQPGGKLRFLLESPRREVDQLPTPERSSQIEIRVPALGSNGRTVRPRRLNAANPQGATTKSSSSYLHESSSDSDEIRPVAISRKKRKNVQAVAVSSSESSEHQTPRKKPSRAPTGRSFLAGGSSGAAPIAHQSGNARRPSIRKRTTNVNLKASSSDKDSTDSESNDDGSPSVRITRQRKREQEKENHDGDEEDHDRILRSFSKKKAPIRRVEISSAEEDDDSDLVIATPIRRRASKPTPIQNDSDEDSMLEELGNAEDDASEKRQTRRGLGNSVQRKRQDALSKLKKKRAGVDEDHEDELEIEDEENENEEETLDEDHSVEDDLEEDADHGTKAEDLDNYESDFIEDDGEIGIDLARHGVPLHLTGQANKKQSEYFKNVVEWMVHNKLDPAFERNDEIYEMAHKKLNDEYLGLAGSEFKSSAWTPEFIKALQSRPELSTLALGSDVFEDKCQACNRSKHPPKWILMLSGPTYDKKSLEKTSPKGADDSTADSDDETDDAEEKKLEFLVGSICCANAEVAHSLVHWRFQLNATILEWLATNGYLDPAQVVEQSEWSRRKKEKFANKIVDGMVEGGEMASLHKEFKENPKAAIATRAEKTQGGSWKGKRR